MSAGVKIVALEDVDKIELPGGSWSRMLLNRATISGTESSLGYSIFKAGSATSPVVHEVEELAYVVAGRGELRLDDEVVTYGAGDALYIAAHTWHAVANTGDEDLIMVFIFPYPDYPPTQRR
ncbi:MAG: cupin domain-containing protein [Candidatus Promineifilaceae bacterium]|nr:cupin domain-containing protein [Candidatus Promineifilaceae bacterium]